MNGRHIVLLQVLAALLLVSTGCQGMPPGLTGTLSGTTAPPVTPVVTGYELVKDVAYGQGDGRPLYLDIYRPLTAIAVPCPAVIWIHGGGWSGGDKYPSQVSLLARAGFFCVSINYRLSGEASFPAALEDARSAIRWLRANAADYRVDPEAIGVWGASAGAHLALLAACLDENTSPEGSGDMAGISSRVQAVCSYYGPTDLTMAFGQPSVAGFIGVPYAIDPEAYRRASPIYYVSPDDPPLLLVHGDRDSLVPLSQSQAMLSAYQKLGLDAKLIVVKNAGHGLGQAGEEPVIPARSQYEQAVLDFFVLNLANR